MNRKGEFPKFLKRDAWLKKPAVFTKDSLIIAGHQVMQRWETNYMRMLAGIATENGGDILEIGFGLGIATHFIQKSQKVKKHIIIEFHPDVIKYCKKLYSKEIKNKKIKLLKGFWEDVIPKLPKESFDGILFDPYPLSKDEIDETRFKLFKESFRLLKKDGILTYYSDADTFKAFSRENVKKLKKAGFKKIDYKICKVNPPKSCMYYNKITIIAPIIRK